MGSENKKYQIGTKENREFLKVIQKSLLEFGRQFPAPDGSSYYLGDDELHGKTEIVRHGLQAGCCMYTVLERCSAIKKARY